MMTYIKPFNEFCKVENLFLAWRAFRRGKTRKHDIQAYELYLEDNLFSLSEALSGGGYTHGQYEKFFVSDPKKRMIHKAKVKDRIVHQALYSALLPVFERRFYVDSYASRKDKGTHRAVKRIYRFIRKESRNFQNQVYVLHCDIEKFFDRIDHSILLRFLSKRISDARYLHLCREIINSYETAVGKGLPLGNLTSQLFANVYLHELDWFVKQKLGLTFYVRYNDDMFFIGGDRILLEKKMKSVKQFVSSRLKLEIPEKKAKIRSVLQGIDVLGTVIYPYGLVPRRRLIRAAREAADETSIVSYLGLLKHTRGFVARENLRLKGGGAYGA